MNMRVVSIAAVLSAGIAFSQAQSPKPSTLAYKPPPSDHCAALGPQSNHEVPIIIEDGSIRVVAYRSHFDKNLLARIIETSRSNTLAQAKTSQVMSRIGSWHTHGNDHILQIAVTSPYLRARGGRTPVFKTKLHQISLDPSDKVEIQLLDGPNSAGSVWLSKEPDAELVSLCHHANSTDPVQLLAWKLLGIGMLKVPRDGIGGNSDFAHLEYTGTSMTPVTLRLQGVRVWSADPAKTSSAFVRAEVKLGSGCAALQICPNDENGNATCRPMNPPCSLFMFKGRPIDVNIELQK